MPLTTIHFNDSEAHSKLFLLLDVTELPLYDPVQTGNNNLIYTAGTGVLFNCPGQIKFTEKKNHRAKTVELNMETTSPVSLAHMSDLLQLNPDYIILYQALEFSNFKLYACATEGSDYEYLTIEGHLLEDDTLLGFLAKGTGIKKALTDLKLAIQMSHRKGSFKKNIRVTITAQFALDGQSVNVEISVPLQRDEVWSLKLLPPGVSFNINTLLKLGMDKATFDNLPTQVTTTPDFNLNSLAIDFDPTSPDTKLRHIGMVLGVGKSDSKPWVILGAEDNPTISLQNIGLSLDMYWRRNGEFNYNGNVTGKVTINTFTIEASIPIPLKGLMTLQVSSPDGTAKLPGLEKISEGLIDEGGLASHLPEGDMTQFTLYLNKLRLAIDLDKKSVQEFELDLKSSTNGSWVIWKDHLELNEFGLNVLLQKTDNAWQSSGSLYGKGHIQNTLVAIRLQKPPTGPWEIALTEPVKFSLQKLETLTQTNLEQNTNNALPAKLTPANGEPLGVRLRMFKIQFQQTEPKLPYFGFYVETTGKLDIIQNKLALEGVFCVLETRTAGNDQRQTTVRVGGNIIVGKHAISLLAQNTDEIKGWEYEGKTQPGDAISLNDLLGSLLQPVGVSLPTMLPQMAVQNIELYYAPKIKQVTFKGAAQITITENISARFQVMVDSKKGEEEKDQSLIINGSGSIALCDATFVLTVAYNSTNKDGWRFTGRASDEIEFTSLLRKLLANTVLALPEVLPVAFTLNRARFEIAPVLKYYLFSGKAELDIRIPKLTSADTFPLKLTLDITLERPAVEAPEAPAQDVQIDVSASAKLELIKDKASILFAGGYSTDKKGWEFDGEVYFEQGLQFDELITALGKLFSTTFSTPSILSGKQIPLTATGVTLNTATKTFTANADLVFVLDKVNNTEVDLNTRLTLTQNQDNTSSTLFLGDIKLGKKEDPYIFNLIFDKRANATWMLANYSGAVNNSVDIGEFINATLKTNLPSGLTIQLNQAMMVYHPAGNDNDASKALFLIGIGNGIDLSNLPLVGKYFTPDKTLKLNFHIQYATEAFNKTDLDSINELLTINTKSPALNGDTLAKSFDLSVNLQMGATIIPIDLNLAVKAPDDKANNTLLTAGDDGVLKPKDGSKDVMNDGLSKWFDIQKKLGPLYFNRIGIGFKNNNLQCMLDASISVGGLTIALAGLTISNPLNKVAPTFGLDGLGIDFKNDVVEIGGSFLRTHVDEEGTPGYDEYDGLAVIKIKESEGEGGGWGITAIGSYAYVNGSPSLFVYAALNYPIGGPAFFFVHGLSAGFGYNRKIVMPALNKVMEFPLLAETLQGKSMPDNAGRDFLLQELQTIHQYIPPANGQIFLAIGLTFSTFKVVDTSLLLVASFGNRFELDLLGVSTLVVPTAMQSDNSNVTSRLASVTLLLKGSFIPSEGFFGIQCVIAPNSYILSKDCVLSGGFAFFAWFNGEHKGDFVATVGGYHPHFKVPAHYPQVPRVGFNWKLGDNMLIKGDVYFALCAHALMAGGHLDATYESGGLKAWFKMGADFLVAWQPYHYEAEMYLDIGCSYTFEFFGTQHITLDLGADVSIWGPEFGGHAVLHLWIFSINVNFGNQESTSLTPIDWKTFEASFLPKANLTNITVSKGLVVKGNDDMHLGVVNPKELTITTDAFIPTKELNCSATVQGNKWNTKFGIGSMDLSADQLQCVQNIKLEKTGDADFKPEDHFTFTALTKKVPAGLWGTQLKPEVNDDHFIENALAGVNIQPKNEALPGEVITVDSNFVQFETTNLPRAIVWETEKTIKVSDAPNKKTIVSEDIIQKKKERDDLLKALGLEFDIDLASDLGEDLITEPVIVVSCQ